MSIIPYVIKQSDCGTMGYNIVPRMLSDRAVFFGEEVTDASANVVIAQKLFLIAQKPDGNIQLYINSQGGSITTGLAIYDTMKYIKCDVLHRACGELRRISAGRRSKGQTNCTFQCQDYDPPAINRQKRRARHCYEYSDCMRLNAENQTATYPHSFRKYRKKHCVDRR